MKKYFEGDMIKLHMFYWIIMLSILNSYLFTIKSYNNSILSDQIAFGGTLVGIVLSIIAIFMTLIGETKTDNTKDKLTMLADELKNILKNIDESNKKTEKILNSNEKLSESIKKHSQYIMNYNISNNSEINNSEVQCKHYIDVIQNFSNRIQDVNLTKNLYLVLYYLIVRINKDPKAVISYQDTINDLSRLNISYQDINNSWMLSFVFNFAIFNQDNDFRNHVEDVVFKYYNYEKNIIDSRI